MAVLDLKISFIPVVEEDFGHGRAFHPKINRIDQLEYPIKL